MPDQDIYIRDRVIAAANLLLGGQKLKNGVMITGGKVLDLDRKLALAKTAGATGADLIHLEFDQDERGVYRLRSLVLMMPRDGVVHLKSDCQLWLSRTGKRALLLPPPGHLGAFRLAPAEVIQVLQRPVDETAGFARAAVRSAELAAKRTDPDGLSVNFALAA